MIVLLDRPELYFLFEIMVPFCAPRSRAVTTSYLMRQPQVCIEESHGEESLSEELGLGKQELDPERSPTGQLPAKKGQSSWLCPVIEEAPSMELDGES